jgi:hypothetical protein
MKLGRKWLVLLVLPLFFSFPAQANPEREFIMSCTYGVLAGTLVGAASLAFVDKPGDNLQRVARGASLGLYAGIALGVYTVYYLPDKLQKDETQLQDVVGEDPYGGGASIDQPKFFPIALEDGLGAGVQFTF